MKTKSYRTFIWYQSYISVLWGNYVQSESHNNDLNACVYFCQILILCNLPPSVLFIFNKIEIQNLHIVISSWKTVYLDLHKYMLLLFIVLNLNKLTKGGLCSGKAHSDSSTNFIYKLVLIIQPSVVHGFFFLWTSHVAPISVFCFFFVLSVQWSRLALLTNPWLYKK